MKKKLTCLLLAVLSLCSVTYAQTSKDMLKERKEIAKASKAELSEKATKTARKEAKRLQKENWKTTPGSLPIEKQLDKSYLMQYEYDEDMFPKYILRDRFRLKSRR